MLVNQRAILIHNPHTGEETWIHPEGGERGERVYQNCDGGEEWWRNHVCDFEIPGCSLTVKLAVFCLRWVCPGRCIALGGIAG